MNNAPSEALHVLYRFYDASGALLYVGITCNPSGRFQRHKKTKLWWHSVARIEMEQYPDRAALAAAERAAIHVEHPRHNVMHRNGEPMVTSEEGGHATDRLALAEASEFDSGSLVGSWFHSDSERGWQGCVVAQVVADVYLVETMSWMCGESYEQRLVRLDDMVQSGWVFYDTAEWMNNAYQTGVERRWDSERKECEHTHETLNGNGG